MNLPRNVLVPIDFSDFSEYALDYAIALAAKLDAKVHLIHAIPIPALGVPELGVALTASTIDSMVKDSETALVKLADARRTKASIGEVLLRTGDPRDIVIQACAEVGADSIVMGTHGRRGVKRALLGSVAESVVRSAQCPVLTIRRGHSQ